MANWMCLIRLGAASDTRALTIVLAEASQEFDLGERTSSQNLQSTFDRGPVNSNDSFTALIIHP